MQASRYFFIRVHPNGEYTMIRKLLVFVFLLTFFCSFGQETVATQPPVDLAILLDSSQSMFTYYDQVVEFVVTGIVSEYMRFGDTLHLISFSDTTQIEIAKKLQTEQDLRTAIARLYLLYPFGNSTDIITALRNSYQYISDLPISNRKLLVLITDGFHSPPDSSPFASYSTEEVRTEIQKIASKYREEGWEIRIISVPFASTKDGTVSLDSNTGSSSSPSSAANEPGSSQEISNAPGAGTYLNDIAEAMSSGITEFTGTNSEVAVSSAVLLPKISIDENLGRKRHKFKLPFTIENQSDRELIIEMNRVIINGSINVLEKNSIISIPARTSISTTVPVKFPSDWQTGIHSIDIEAQFADNQRVRPAVLNTVLEINNNPLLDFFDNSLRVFLLILSIFIAGAVIVLVLFAGRAVHRRADTVVVDTVLDGSSNDTSTVGLRKQGGTTAVSSHDNADVSILSAVKNRAATGLSLNTTVAQAKNESVPSSTILSNYDRQPSSLNPLELRKSQPSILQDYNANTSQYKLRSGTQHVEGSGLPLKTASKTSLTDLSHEEASANSNFQLQTIKPGILRVEFFVEGQNRAIGRRNIKTLHAGGKKSIGGRRTDDFLVFLLPIGHNIADICYDGAKLVFVPRKPIFIESNNQDPFELALGDRVYIRSRKGKIMKLYFEQYISPKDKLNQLLHCVEAPGISALLEADSAKQSE